MPRYFFDIRDGEHVAPDRVGVDLDGLEAATAEAKRALPDIVRDEMPDGDRRALTVVVKDETGRALVQVTLSLVVERLP
jgi:hypothetical protein